MHAPPDIVGQRLADALARKFRSGTRGIDFNSTARARNQRRNLNLDALQLIEDGHTTSSARVAELIQKIADLQVKPR